jgi:superfamily II DNA or RNA helicase
MATVIRRRRGEVTRRITAQRDGTRTVMHRLGVSTQGTSIQEQLMVASERVQRALAGETIVDSIYTLREKQRPAFVKWGAYLVDIAAMREGRSRWCHLVWPPRVGKMVLFTEVIASCGLPVLILQETRQMVGQTYRHIRKQLPTISVGKYFGGERSFRPRGVTIATYAMAQRYYKVHGCLPSGFADVALVMLDEAHHTMTYQRMEMLRGGFHEHAIRFALTATPDYDNQRALARFFPERIDEITLAQAIDADLLAPMRFVVMGVDQDASSVQVVRGEYDEEDLLRVMGAAPFFKAALDVRYDRSDKVDPALLHRDRSCLITCVSRQHARDCYEYFLVHRPKDAPPPGLILGDTPDQKRDRLLEAYDNGEIDTLICVAVLLEGWSSEQCKLLLDLAPSLSEVRAKQKLFRPMTRSGDEKAYVYQLMPQNLRKPAVLPTDLFGSSFNRFGSTVNFEPLAKPKKRQVVTRVRKGGAAQVDDVDAKVKILLEATPRQWKLNPHKVGQVREVILTGHTPTKTVPSLRGFKTLVLDHVLFAGSGRELLRFCGVESSYEAFVKFIQWVYPELAADQFLRKHKVRDAGETEPVSCWEDYLELEYRAREDVVAKRAERVPVAWRLMGEPCELYQASPEDLLIQKQEYELVQDVMQWEGMLSERSRQVLIAYDSEGKSYTEIARELELTMTRVCQIHRNARRALAYHVNSLADEPFVNGWPEPTHFESRAYWKTKARNMLRRETALREEKLLSAAARQAKSFHTECVERFGQLARLEREADDQDRLLYAQWMTVRKYYLYRKEYDHRGVIMWEFDRWDRKHMPNWPAIIPEPEWVAHEPGVEIRITRPQSRWW